MSRIVRLTLSAGAAALVCACTSDSPQQPISEPIRASFSDGAHSGNPDFFFLPPLFKSPTTDPNYSPGEFNAALQPRVEICELGTLVPPATIRPCVATITTFAGSAVALDVASEQYRVNWNTNASNLVLTKEYRIQVLLGTQVLGFADVDPVSNTGQLRNVQTGDFIGLVDGRTLPIKFRIENGAACFGGACDSKTIPLAQGGFVVLTATGDRVDIPAQQSGQTVTVTVSQCENLNVDLPVFGNCVRVTSDPPLAARLSPAATVSMCSLDPLSLPLAHAQQDLLTLHRQDDELVVALPHSEDFCGGTIGRRDDAPTTFAARAWLAARHVATWIFKPATLHATTMVLDVGAGGQTDGFSDFQLALPAKMNIVSLADQATSPNTAVSSVPEVVVTDADGNPVANALVHFQITSTGGGSIAPLAGVALSNADGHASLTSWTVGAAGRHTLQAFGKGIADPENNGPASGFDPFAPAVLHDPAQDEAQPPVTLGTGRLGFGATAGQADLIIATLTHSPADPTTEDLIDFGVTVTNQGTAATGPFYVVVTTTQDGALLETTTLGGLATEGSSLAAGESRTLCCWRSTRAAGEYVQTAVADFHSNPDLNNQVPESNEANNTGTDRYTVMVGAINFETFPGGTPACDNCALTDQFASRGVVFSFSPESQTCTFTNAQLFLSSSVYDEVGGPGNHSVTAAGLPAGGFCNGTVSATFAAAPRTVTFRIRGNDGIAVYPIFAFDAEGGSIPASQIQRTNVSTFTSVGGFSFRQETITINSGTGISEVDLVMNGFIVLLDNLLITP